MALIQLGDLQIEKEVLLSYIAENLEHTNNFLASGAVTSSDFLNQFLVGAGETVAVPNWSSIDNATFATATDDETEITPEKVGTDKQVAVRMHQARAWKGADLATLFNGANGLDFVASQLMGAINYNRQAHLLAMISGVTDTGGVIADHINDQSGAAFDPDFIIDAEQIWADKNLDQMATLVVHPVIYGSMKKMNMVDVVRLSDNSPAFSVFMDTYRVVVDATVPVDTGVYTSYILRPSAILGGSGAQNVVTERSELQGTGWGTEALISRDSFTYHVPGLSFTGTYAGATPTGTELADVSNYSKVFRSADIGVAGIKSLK